MKIDHHHLRNELSIYLFAVIFLSCLAAIYFFPEQKKDAGPIKNGCLDLSDWDGTIIPLSGCWEFARNEFRTDGWGKNIYTELPSTWKNNRFGYASYRMLISGLEPGMEYALKIPYMATAYTLYLNKKKVSANGRIGKTRRESVPKYAPAVILFTAGNSDTELILMVSNFHHRRGGAFQTIYLGDKEDISRMDFWNVISDWAFVLIYLAMGFSQLFVLLIRKDKTNFSLMLLFLVIGLNGLFGTPNVLIFRYLPRFPWALYQKICYYLSYSSGLLIILFIHNLYGGLNRKIYYIVLAPFFLIYLFVTVTPSWIFSIYNNIYQVHTFLVLSFAFGIIIQAVIQKKPGAKAILFAFLILFSAAWSGTFFSNDRISSQTYLPLAFLRYYHIQIKNLYSLPLTTLSYILLLTFANIFSLSFLFNNPQIARKNIDFKDEKEITELKKRGESFGLSDRELEVTLLMLQGMTNKEIAEKLFISLSTVKTHISRIFKKTDAETRTELFFLFQK